MRRIAWLVVLCVSGAGCRVCELAWRTLIEEPCQYSEDVDRHEARARSRQLAQHALAERCWSAPEAHVSQDYADGFCHGFTEYVLGGGTALPPPLPLPPRKYWRDEYATPGGQQAARDWLAGAYDGIQSAQASGHREWMTVPASMSLASGAAPHVIIAPEGTPVESGPADVGPAVPPPPAENQDPSAAEPEQAGPSGRDATAGASTAAGPSFENSGGTLAAGADPGLASNNSPADRSRENDTTTLSASASATIRVVRSALHSVPTPNSVPTPIRPPAKHSGRSDGRRVPDRPLAAGANAKPASKSLRHHAPDAQAREFAPTTLCASATSPVPTPAHHSVPAPTRPLADDSGAAGGCRVTDNPLPASVPTTEPAGHDSPELVGPAMPEADPDEELSEASPE